MSLFPPLCLEALFSPGSRTGNDYTATLLITPQTYVKDGVTSSSYNGTHVKVGMYATSNFNGQVFCIKSITSQTAGQVVAILEDVDGTNKIIDTSGGINGGGPRSGRGYIFELNSEGIPVLTAINNPPTTTFPDSIMGRFHYDNLKVDKTQSLETYCVAVGSGTTNYFATSKDGITWIGRGKGPFTTAVYNVAYNGSIWVAVGEGTNTIATSPDGITWTGRVNPIPTRGRGIAWNGNVWVAVGDSPVSTSGKVATSPDGINWTDRTLSGMPNCNAVAWNGSLLVLATSSSGNRIYTSPDGITWTQRSVTVNGISTINTVAWGNNLWVAGGTRNTNASISSQVALMTSLDGINWTGRGATVTGSVISECRDVAYNGSHWVAVGGNRSTSAITSEDGSTWINPKPAFGSSGETRGESITWNGSLWVGVGLGLNVIVTSTNGIDWITQQTSTGVFSGDRGFGVSSRFGYPYALPNKRLVVTESGSAIAPSIYENDSVSTGIFFPSKDNLAITTAGAERMRINNTGNLTVTGRMGIGTTEPGCGLQVIPVQSSSTTQRGTPSASTHLSVLNSVTSASTESVLAEIGSHNRSVGNFGSIYKYQLGFQNTTGGSGGNFIINAVPTGSASYDTDGTAVNRFFIRNNGNIGVGTTDPIAKLTLSGTESTNSILLLNNSLNNATRSITNGLVSNEICGLSSWATGGVPTDAGQLRLSAGGGTNVSTKSYIDLYGFDNRFISFGTSGTERMRITNNGNIDMNGRASVTKPVPTGQIKSSIYLDSTNTESTNVSEKTVGELVVSRNDQYSARIKVVQPAGNLNDQVLDLRFATTSGFADPFTQTDRMTIKSISGNVGIGTTDPNYPLDVNTTTATSNTSVCSLATAIADTGFRLVSQRGATTNNSEDVVVRLGLQYRPSTNNSMIQFHRGVGATGGFMTFTTNNDTERMRINGAGNVGIGTTNPSNLLHLQKGSYSNGSSFGINLGSLNYIDQAKILCVDTNTSGTSSGVLAFNTSVDGAASTEKMRITGAGNVGIGITDPTQRLDVNGRIRGLGNIVNVQTHTGSVNTLTGISRSSGLDVINITYSPVQTGTVRVVVYSALELIVGNGTGSDGASFTVYASAPNDNSRPLSNYANYYSGGTVVTRSANYFGQGVSTTTITGTNPFRIYAYADSDDGALYRNAYLVIHELSNAV